MVGVRIGRHNSGDTPVATGRGARRPARKPRPDQAIRMNGNMKLQGARREWIWVVGCVLLLVAMFVVADRVEQSWATGDAARPRPRAKPAPPATPATVPVALRVTDVALDAARVSLRGRVTTGARVSVAGRRARVRGDRFRIGIPLKDGTNRLTITARKPGASGATARLTVQRPTSLGTTAVTPTTSGQSAAPPSTTTGVQPSATVPGTTTTPTSPPTTSVPRRRVGPASSPAPAAPRRTLTTPRSAPAPSPAPPKASPKVPKQSTPRVGGAPTPAPGG